MAQKKTGTFNFLWFWWLVSMSDQEKDGKGEKISTEEKGLEVTSPFFLQDFNFFMS